MKPIYKPKQRTMAFLLAVLVVSGGIPFVVGTHINDFTPWRDTPEDPTGNSLLDGALRTAADALDGVAENQQIKPLREEPQTPATFFHDIFDPDDRVGGLGPWIDDQNGQWHLDDAAAGHRVEHGYTVGGQTAQTDGQCITIATNPPTEECAPHSVPVYHREGVERGYQFGGPHGYPTSPGDAVLVSPLISLRSLPVELPPERNEVPGVQGTVSPTEGDHTVDLTRWAADQRTAGNRIQQGHAAYAPAAGQGTADMDRILLRIDHRYHFGCFGSGSPRDGIRNCDWGSVRVRDAAGHETPLWSLNGVFTDNGGPTLGPNSTFGKDAKFYGYQDNFTEETFDLSPWAGEDVRIVFKAHTGKFDQDHYFGNSAYFDPEAEFYGWDLSNIRVEGPAHRHNVRLDRVLDPEPADGHTIRDGEYVALQGSDPVKVLLLNRGQVTEDGVEVTMEVKEDTTGDGIKETSWICDRVTVNGLRPGELRNITFLNQSSQAEPRPGCLDIKEGDEYRVVFTAELPGTQRRDLYEPDNVMEITIREDGPDVHLSDLVVDPNPAPPGFFEVNATLTNRGLTRTDAILELRIDRFPPGGGNLTKDVQWDNATIQLGEKPVNQTVQIDGTVPGDGVSSLDVTWPLEILEAGVYQVKVSGMADGDEPIVLKSVTASIWDTPAFAYETTDFTVANATGDAAVAGAWEAVSMFDQAETLADLCKPDEPDEPDELDECEVWSLMDEVDLEQPLPEAFGINRQKGLMDVALRGEFRLPEDDLATPLTHLTIEVVHQAQNLRCSIKNEFDGGNPSVRPQPCDVPGTLDALASSRAPFPENQLYIALVEGAPTAGHAWGGRGSNSPPRPQPTIDGDPSDINIAPLQHVGGSHYRNAYYNGQWITETYDVNICNSPSLGGSVAGGFLSTKQCRQNDLGLTAEVSAAALADAALEFRMRGVQCPVDHDASCPSWHVAKVSVVGTHADTDAEVDMLRWSGIDDDSDEQGTWYSYFESPGRRYTFGVSAGAHARAQAGEEPFMCVSEAGEDQLTSGDAAGAVRCPSWKRQPMSDLVPVDLPGPTWRFDPVGQYYTNAQKTDVDELYRSYWKNPGGAIDLLQSPVFEVPGDGEPKVEFDHRFRLHPYVDENPGLKTHLNWWNVWKNSPSYADSGMVMIRFMDIEDGTPETPWLPVPTHEDSGNDPLGRLMGDDCGFRSGDDCNDVLFNRDRLVQEFDLKELDILDYRQLDAQAAWDGPPVSSSGWFGNGLSGASTDDGSNDGGPFTDVSSSNNAHDLRSCTDEGLPATMSSGGMGDDPCHIQFAFRLEVPDPIVGTYIDKDDTTKSFTSFKQKAWEAVNNTPSPGQEGWFINGFRITAANTAAFDLALTGDAESIEMVSGYDWTDLGFGPDSEATANLTIRNNGLFAVDAAQVSLTVLDADDGTEVSQWTKELLDLQLPPGEKTTVEVPFTMPEVDGQYRFAADLEILGELAPGLGMMDLNPVDNCLRLQPSGAWSGVSPDNNAGCIPRVLNEGGTPISVTSNPKLSMELDITPQAGRTGEEFSRTVDLRIRNEGNVVVHDALLDIVVKSPSENYTKSFILKQSPLPTASERWGTGNVTLLDPLQETEDGEYAPTNPLSRIPLNHAETYFVTAFLRSAPQGELEVGDAWTAKEQVRLDGFEVIYSDSFSKGGRDDQPGMVAPGSSVEPEDSVWLSTKGMGSDGRTNPTEMWRFGNAQTGRYPDGADTSLYLPAVDVSSAQRATFSLSHQYELERGFDGARVEACIGNASACSEDNATWLPLEPRGGYGGTVAAGSPLNPDNDPRRKTSAFTGSSTARFADGWVVDEFDLSQLPDFTTPIVLQRFSQDGMEGPHEEDFFTREQSDERISYHTSWSTSARSCPDACWYRDNIHRLDPIPLEGSSGFWWTGSAGEGKKMFPSTSMTVQFDLDGIDLSDKKARATYQVWKDHSGEFTTELKAGVTDDLETDEVHEEPTDGWNRHIMDLPKGEPSYDLTFEFKDTLRGPGGSLITEFPNRGAALDQLQVEVYAKDGSGKETIHRTVPLLTGMNVSDRVTLTIKPDPDLGDLEWEAVPQVDRTPEAWGVAHDVQTRQGEFGPVWQFGTAFDNGEDEQQLLTYPANARERLVTPLMDLSGVSGETANLTYWEHYALTANDRRCVYAQVIEPTPSGGEEVSEWKKLDGACSQFGNSRVSSSQDPGCTNNDWCPVDLDISEYRGQQKVRFAFEIATTRLIPDTGGVETSWHWSIDEVGIKASALVGQPVQLRLRAATDASIGDGHWAVESVQLVGNLYEDNMAVIPDEPFMDHRIRPGGNLSLTGQVRNLGPDGADAYLRLIVESESAHAPEVRFLTDRFGMDTETAGPIGPIELMGTGERSADGTLRDRIPYRIEVAFPDATVEEDSYRLRFGLVADEQGASLRDDNVGDDGSIFVVTIDDTTEFGLNDIDLSVYPPTVKINETADIRFRLDNTGVNVVDDSLVVTATRLDGDYNVTLFNDTIDPVQPGGVDTSMIEWAPTVNETGFYRITAEIGDLTPVHDYVLVGKKPLWYAEKDFASGDGWSFNCPPLGSQEQGPTECWGRSTVYRDQGTNSIFIGNDDLNDPQAGYHRTKRGTTATSPSIDLAHLLDKDLVDGGDIQKGKSPFSPFFSLRYKSMLDEGHVVQVRARPCDNDGGFKDLKTKDVQTDRTGTEGLTGQNDRVWRVANFPLFHEENNVCGTGKAVLSKDTAFQFEAEWDAYPEGIGFAVDSVTISSYAVEVLPRSHDAVLRPGSDKVFYFHVANTGAAHDTYRLAVDHQSTDPSFLDQGATIEILNENGSMALDPGESELVAVRVAVPFKDLTGIAGAIQVNIASQTDPNRVATAVVSVNEFVNDDLPDLVTTVRRPGDESGPVGETEQATFIVSVANTGRQASRPTDLVLFACPTTYEDEQGRTRDLTVEKCGKDKRYIEIAESTIPALIAPTNLEPGERGDVSTQTFRWIPELKQAGTYHIIAVADPAQKISQYNRESAVTQLDLTVAPLERPDLHVTDLRVTDDEGRPLTRANAGDVMHIQGTVRNDGNTAAHNVEIRIVNQFALKEGRVNELNPGATQTLKAQWVAQPGNWIILFEAFSKSDVELDPGMPNTQRWSLAVRSGTLEAEWEPSILHLEPDQTTDVVLKVRNKRDMAADLELVPTTSGLTLSGMPGTLELARGASRELPVQVSVSPFAKPGRYTADVALTMQHGTTAVAAATLEVHVGAQRSVRMSHEPIFIAPGRAEVGFLFHNDGDAPEALDIRVDPPENWVATPLSPSIRLDAGVTRPVQVALEVPAGTPAGRYPISVDLGDDVAAQTAFVDVVRQARWTSQIDALHAHEDRIQVQVRTTNIGNAPAPPAFGMLGGSPFHVDPRPEQHEPGETRTYRVTATAGDTTKPMIQLPGRDAPTPLQRSDQHPEVEAVRLAVQQGGAIHAGDKLDIRFSVRSAGAEMQQRLPVRLWVDGGLAAEQVVDLGPGESREVDFRTESSKAGARVITATVGSGDATIARTTVIDVLPSGDAVSIPDPGMAVLLTTLALAAVAMARRRRS